MKEARRGDRDGRERGQVRGRCGQRVGRGHRPVAQGTRKEHPLTGVVEFEGIGGLPVVQGTIGGSSV